MKVQTYGKIAVALISLAALTYLNYQFNQNVVDNANKEKHLLGLVFKMKQVDANWTSDVLQAYVGLSKDYDSLSNSVKELPVALQNYSEDVSGRGSQDEVAVNAELDKLFKEKTQLTEKFKRRNAVLKNSLRYLPTAQTEINTVLADDKARATTKNELTIKQKEDVEQLISLVLRYNLFPDDELAASVHMKNESIRLSFSTLDPKIWEKMRNLVRHVDVILSERVGVAQLVSRINTMPITEKLDVLGHEINKRDSSQVSTMSLNKMAVFYGGIILLAFILIGVTWRNRTT